MTDEEIKKRLEKVSIPENFGDIQRIDRVQLIFIINLRLAVTQALALINRLEYENDLIGKKTASDILLQFASYRAASPALSATWYALAEKYGVEVDK